MLIRGHGQNILHALCTRLTVAEFNVVKLATMNFCALFSSIVPRLSSACMQLLYEATIEPPKKISGGKNNLACGTSTVYKLT